MGSPGSGNKPYQTDTVTTPQNLVVCYCPPARFAHSDLFPVPGVACEGLFDAAPVLFELASHCCEIDTPDGVILELGRQRVVSRVVLGRHHNTRGPLVQTVNDAGPHDPAYS